MGTRRKSISPRHGFALIALMGLFGLSGCLSLGGRPAVDPLTPAEHLSLAISYEHEGRLEPALREYERAAIGPLRSRALTGQGNVHSTQRKMPEAEASFRAAIAADSANAIALNNLAWLLAHKGQSLDEARSRRSRRKARRQFRSGANDGSCR